MSAMRMKMIFLILFGTVFSSEEIVSQELSAEIVDAQPLFGSFFSRKTEEPAQNGYTINYTTVSIIEYIRFASKICKINFIYEEADLDFTITVVSDEPVTPQNVMATLIQVLRIHDLQLLEQDNNLVIHKAPNVRQIATLVTDQTKDVTAPIVTRIFRLKNARPDAIAAIVQPMISATALLEISPETQQLIVTDITANVDKIAALIENLDSPHTTLDIQKYSAVHNQPAYLVNMVSQIMNPIAQGTPFILVPQDLSYEIFIVSTPELAAKAIDVFKSLDIVPKEKGRKLNAGDIYVYKILNSSGPVVLRGLESITDNLKEAGGPDPALVDTLESAKWIRETNSIMFVGTSSSLAKLKELLPALDSLGTSRPEHVSFFIYQPKHRSAENTRKALVEMADNLKGAKGISQTLVDTILDVKLNPLTHTLTFTGPETDFPKIKDLLATVDSASAKPASKKDEYPPSTQFLIYKPVNQSGKKIAESLQDITAQLKSDKLADPGLLHALSSMKWVESTNSLLFTGDPEALKKLQSLITTLDISATQAKTFLQYHTKYADQSKTENYLKQVIQNLVKKGGTDSLVETLKSYKWIPESQTFMFYGSQPDLDQVKSLMESFDTPQSASQNNSAYYIYKVQHTTGEIIEEDLDNLAKNLSASGLKDSDLLNVIGKIRYVKQTNSLILSGSPKGIEEVKELLTQYDYPRAAPQGANNFLMYKPINVTANVITNSLRELGTNLKNAGLADPTLLQSIESSKYVESTNTIVFTGPQETLTKISEMLKEIDTAPTTHAPIQQIGKSTFLLYKLKNAKPDQIMSSLKNMTADLKKSGNSDKSLVTALASMKYIKETNSLFFTGPQDTLAKIQPLLEQLDVQGSQANIATPTTGPGTYFVYKPQSLPGTQLEAMLQHFSENLKSSGLVDNDLYQTISAIRWSDQTQTLIITGTQKAIDQVKELLKEFDIPANLQNTGSPADSIQSIDNTSFLVYKLQFHKGDEIQNALRQIAKDLMNNNAPINTGLLNSINSIQWLEVTNSLLTSGDQDTLTRLRELIKNLDIPLKQVFIEMLVIETSLANALTFGLEWGGNYKFMNKFGAAAYNTPFTSGSPDAFITNLSQLTPPAEPTPINKIPPSSGFDLGVIGEVIKHNGQTFLTLGSLLNALQTDAETSVLITPKILTQDGRTSTIFDGRNIPFVGSFVQNNGNNTVNTSNIEYRDIGLNLTITPVLGNSDIVTLDINLERTDTLNTGQIGSTINFNQASASGITTTKTTMQTTVHVPDNNFLVLSGLVNSSNIKTTSAIPCLGGLPLIGAAFSQNNNTNANSNIVIFIRPHIINSVDEMRGITKHEEDYFRDLTGSPFLEKNYDEALELLKTIDDD